MHPLFRFVPDEADNQAIWDRLTPLYWSAGTCQPKPAAEVLAVRGAGGRTGAGSDAAEPLAVQHFAGAGRAMYFGFDESWRWRLREDEARYNQFWLQAVKYLARTRLGRVELRTDKQVPYRQGEPIRVTVRFPDDVPPPDGKTNVQVTAEYIARGGEVEAQTLKPAKLPGSRATYEATLTRYVAGPVQVLVGGPGPAWGQAAGGREGVAAAGRDGPVADEPPGPRTGGPDQPRQGLYARRRRSVAGGVAAAAAGDA